MKEKPRSYCEFVVALEKNNIHRVYHDSVYGFRVDSDDELFERLVLEINQAGLSWNTILGKQENFRKAFEKFEIAKVSCYGEKEKARLMADAGIIRNRLKIEAAINNAKVILQLQKEFGSFEKWLDANCGKSLEQWIKLFKQTFKFTGGEIVKEFLLSTGYLPGAHDENCPIRKKLI